jgi:ketosteroid isomerase-like protein
MTHPNADLLTLFYTAFQRRDGNAMAACYHPEAMFSDPVFPRLPCAEAGAMWRMLAGRAKDLEIRFKVLAADEEEGEVAWEADYTFSKTGRKVHNVIRARFAFKDGLILAHRDGFDLPAWARQAMGWKGLLFGRMGWFQDALRAEARKGLLKFMERG